MSPSQTQHAPGLQKTPPLSTSGSIHRKFSASQTRVWNASFSPTEGVGPISPCEA